MAYVFDKFGECSSSQNGGGGGGSLAKGISITGSVGRGGRNLRDDVVSIQEALNRITPIQGGPTPALVVDGFVGPKTVAAIERFQKVQFTQKFPDGRVDPGQRTITRINELTGKHGVVASPSQAGQVLGFQQRSSLVQGTTDAQMRAAEALALDAEKRLTAAVTRLKKAVLAVAKSKRTAEEETLVREINWHFKANADPSPAAHMTKVQTILSTMLVAVKEQNLGTRSIFKKGTHPDPQAIAAATEGGWFSMKQDERFIIITPNFRTQSSGVIIHELGHFCGPAKTTGGSVAHRASPAPFPNGTKKEDGSTNYKDMSAFQARTNVYSYQIYCFPEMPEFKVP